MMGMILGRHIIFTCGIDTVAEWLRRWSAKPFGNFPSWVRIPPVSCDSPVLVQELDCESSLRGFDSPLSPFLLII